MLENNTTRLVFFIIGAIVLGIFLETVDFETLKESLVGFFSNRHQIY